MQADTCSDVMGPLQTGSALNSVPRACFGDALRKRCPTAIGRLVAHPVTGSPLCTLLEGTVNSAEAAWSLLHAICAALARAVTAPDKTNDALAFAAMLHMGAKLAPVLVSSVASGLYALPSDSQRRLLLPPPPAALLNLGNNAAIESAVARSMQAHALQLTQVRYRCCQGHACSLLALCGRLLSARLCAHAACMWNEPLSRRTLFCL